MNESNIFLKNDKVDFKKKKPSRTKRIAKPTKDFFFFNIQKHAQNCYESIVRKQIKFLVG